MVGRLAPEKNLPLAFDVMREVINKINALLIIVGDGIERKILDKEVLNGLEANVKFEGWQDGLGRYYNSADMLLITSDYEGYGMNAVEAIGCGLPVIMSDVGVAGEIVRNGENGIIVPVGDKMKFVEAIWKLKDDANFREKLRRGARETKMPYSSFEDYRDKLINSFKTCWIR
jgi:glycosyltransferase involved in cell wall biosynthesis